MPIAPIVGLKFSNVMSRLVPPPKNCTLMSLPPSLGMMLMQMPEVPDSASMPDVVNVVSAASIGFMYCFVAPSLDIVLTSRPST